MCVVHLDPCSVWEERQVTARKAHRCSGCGGAIQPGERYVRHFSLFEGDVTTGKVCLACDAVRNRFAGEHGGMLCTPGYLRELLADCVADGDEGSAIWQAALDEMDARRAAA